MMSPIFFPFVSLLFLVAISIPKIHASTMKNEPLKTISNSNQLKNKILNQTPPLKAINFMKENQKKFKSDASLDSKNYVLVGLTQVDPFFDGEHSHHNNRLGVGHSPLEDEPYEDSSEQVGGQEQSHQNDNKNPAGGAGGGSVPSDKEAEMSKTVGVAMRAAEEAQAASHAQNVAGMQAAREVKHQLAEKAQRAANAAQAALSEKQNEVQILEDQIHDAESVLLEEHASLNQTRNNLNTARKTVESAKEQYQTLETALSLAEKTIQTAEELSTGAQNELSEKIKLMNAAKTKLYQLENELERARKDFLNTKESAIKAMQAAEEAKMNVNKKT